MEGNSIKTFQNLCKIFEMKIKLDRAKGDISSEEVLDNYEKYAIKIDNFYNEEFQKELKKLISSKDTLEEEKTRLEKLINLLEDRLKKRSNLAGDFHNTTGKYIKNLQLIVSDSELNSKKERLDLITKYLDATKEIEDVKKEINDFTNELSLEKKKKEEYENRNKLMEDELYSVFVTSTNNDSYYREIEEDKILDILEEVSIKARDNKETLEITKESVANLVASGVSEEYNSYIEEASKNYALWKDREIILKIYKLVIDFKEEFEELLAKRNEINALLEERKENNNASNILVPFEKVMNEQNATLANEREILNSIENYNSRIDFKEERLNELEEVLNEPEIVLILEEYHLKDSKEDALINKVDLPTENTPDNIETPKEDNLVIKEYDPYTIISVIDAPATLNIGLAKLKGDSVREQVNKKLNPEIISNQSMSTFEVSGENQNTINNPSPVTNNIVVDKPPIIDIPNDTVEANTSSNEVTFPGLNNDNNSPQAVASPDNIDWNIDMPNSSEPIINDNNQTETPSIQQTNNEIDTNNKPFWEELPDNSSQVEEVNPAGGNFSFPNIEGDM